ncbi:diaminopimelate decarboxylase [candidate division WOR-1 bacterium RIFOXYB2_FULL_42_35]|uniref:Diaminopimelate decarboxylase n=1 Tax=candidate division WOR-1 bacterium RIFOXYC2_FULL_41_25 TaxID=1802586 RepID=A0A1F4TIE9_UNCSA|nr:MAG: diaminopimelate decarboxylase [candidate division WOR-1 bacterium RIFOXYA2_FULL_41_14]OGC24076.1 MAG: diaminopimelate decarboxylase [candidate division WOR-1 bacterium RIFOXYB2_FULL_42_35]OGC32498.1 MAG: diaminopimelate decarboxylase [candidate division WOR-1 bacterium RIFOXYC2_FULL_41_25]OGC43838.1 MAG: diaminopimelate decarboxylase [candidate division WOR-1 bacterium RIFOXYD2_FULL_41_8]
MTKNLPVTTKINQAGHLEIGGCDLVEVAQEFGTPLYVLDEATIRDRCQQYVNAFKKHHANTEVIYASKALCTAALLKIVASEGLGFDCSSGGEIYTALKAGCDPKKIYFHGNNKPKKELGEAVSVGVGRIVVDNLQELENLDEVTTQLGKRAEILFRINPQIEAHTHDYIKTGQINSKFGIALDKVDEAVKIAKSSKSISLMGLHAHIGSQIFDVDPFVDEVKLLLALVKKHQLPELNIGGGVGVAYTDADNPAAIAVFAERIAQVLKDDAAIKLILEPGRSIICNAGITLYTIGGVKEIARIKKYIFIDGGMSDNPRPILYQAQYDAKIANKANIKPEEVVTVAGRFCESGDILIKDIKLPKVAVGDVLAVVGTGAYNYSMASNYNRVGRPAMVLLNEGNATLIINRESYEDLILNDVII